MTAPATAIISDQQQRRGAAAAAAAAAAGACSAGSVRSTAVASPVDVPVRDGLGGERVLEVGLERRRVRVAAREVLVGHAVEHGGEPRGDLRAA